MEKDKISSCFRQFNSIFKEKFVFQVNPATSPSEELGKFPDSERRRTLEEAQTSTSDMADTQADDLTFAINSQDDFNKTMEDIVNQSPDNIDKLIAFALNSEKSSDNMDEILDAFEDEDELPAKLSGKGLTSLLYFYKADEDNLETLIDLIFEAAEENRIETGKLTQTIKFFQDDKDQFSKLISRLYESIEDEDISLNSINKELLGILIGHFWEKSDSEKIDFLLDESCKSAEGASKLLEISSGQEEFIKAVFEKIKDKTDIIQNISEQALIILIHQTGVKKILPLISINQKINLISKANFSSEEQDLLIKSIDLNTLAIPFKIAIINTGTINPGFRKILFQSLSEADQKTITEEVRKTLEEPATEAKTLDAEAAEVESAPKTIDLAKVSELTAILNEAGLTNRGRFVVWDLTLDDKTKSERSFVRTAKFKEQFETFINEQKASGKPLDADQVKLFCYQYLWREIYKNGKRKGNPFKLDNFEKSQAALQAEKSRLEAKFTAKPEMADAASTGAASTVQAHETAHAEATDETTRLPRRDEAEPESPRTERDAPISELDILKQNFFPNFEKIEETTRKIKPGKYQLENLPTISIYQENLEHKENTQSDFQFFEIKEPRIFKLTNKDGKSTFVIKAEQFFKKDFDQTTQKWILNQSTNPQVKQTGFINVNDIITADESDLNNDKTDGPEIESEWNLEPKFSEDLDLIKGKEYDLKPGSSYYLENHISKPVTTALKVTVTDNKIREVEGEKFAKVKISGLENEAWINKNQLQIPPEDTFWISSDESGPPQSLPEGFKTNGKFEFKGKMRGSDLLEAIFSKFPKLKAQLEESGLSNIQYLYVLAHYRNNDILNLIVPQKQLATIMAEFEEKAENTEFEAGNSTEHEKIDNNRQDYFDRPRYLSNPELVKAINDDELWNDLLEKKGPYIKKFIDGFEKVSKILEQFGINEENLRGELKNLLQEGINEKITFKEIFDRYFKKKIYIFLTEKNGDQEGTFSQFKLEITELETTLKPWQSTEGKAKIEKINHFHETLRLANIAKIQAQEQDQDFTKTPEWIAYEKSKQETEAYREEYLRKHQDAEETMNTMNIPEKFARLQQLKEKILFPISELLDALESMNVKVSKEQNFNDQYEATLSLLPQTAETPVDRAGYFHLQSLIIGNDDPAKMTKAPENMSLISISQKTQEKFNKTLGELSIDPAQFPPREILRLIFQIYSVQTLSHEKCLQRSKEGSSENNFNKFILTDLPKNFTSDNPQIKALFEQIKSGQDISKHKELIQKISEIIDKNKAVIKRLMEVFGKEEGPMTYNLIPIDLLGISYLIRALDGEDRRELEMTMSDIGERRDSLLPDDFLHRYSTDKSAFTDILSTVTKTEDGAAFYQEELLQTELTRRANRGLSYILLDTKNYPKLMAQLSIQFGDINIPDNFTKAREALEKRINNSDKPLDNSTIELIRIGHVIDGVVEKSKQAIVYSKNDDIRKIQEELVKNDIISTPEDANKVEEILAGGLLIPVNGSLGVDIFKPYNLGKGWTITPMFSANTNGVTAGVAVSKGIELSKNGRSILTLSVNAGVLHIGGSIGLKFPISDKVDMNVGGTGGIMAVGFYALGVLEVRKNLNAEAVQTFRREIENKGFTEVDNLIKNHGTDIEVAESLIAIPHLGAKFEAIRNQGVPDAGLKEIYRKVRENIDARSSIESEQAMLEVIGGGAFGGVVDGVPVAGAYLEIAVGDKTMIIRKVVPGAPQAAEFQIQKLLNEKLGKSVEISQTMAEDSGDFIYDSTSGQMAILDGQNNLKYSDFDGFGSFNKALNEAKMGISQGTDSSIRLHVENPGVKANIKIIVDPLLKKDGIYFTVHENKVLFKGVSEAELRGLIITREDFHYPMPKEGVMKFSVVTIKNNPVRLRSQIEQEAPSIIYQNAGFRPDIREGAGKGKLESNILNFEEFGKLQLKREDTVEARSLEEFSNWSRRNHQVHNVIERSSFDQEPRTGLIPDFAKEFYQKNRLAYRKLSTQGQETENNEKLNQLIVDFAAQKSFENLTPRELTDIHLYLLHSSFMSADDKLAVFKANLEVCKNRVLKPAFIKAAEKLGLKYKGPEMAEYVAKELGKINVKSKNFEQFAEGTLFLSAAGTMDIWGLRGTSYYGGKDLDLIHGIIGFKEYNPAKTGIEGDIAKAILEILSPLEIDPAKHKEFLESPLARKLGNMDAMYSILGPNDATKLTDCFEAKEVTEENKAAFEKFRDIVIKVREAELSGNKNYIDLPGNYTIIFKTRLGIGSYKKCTNPTFAGTEDLEIWGPGLPGTVVQHKEKILLNYHTIKKAIPVILGLRISLPGEKPVEEQPPVDEEKPIVPKPKPAGGVSTEAPAPANQGDPTGRPHAPGAHLGGSGGPGLE